jgi:hypothetical protein
MRVSNDLTDITDTGNGQPVSCLRRFALGDQIVVPV